MIECHVCHVGDVIEGAPPVPERPSTLDIRVEALSLWSLTHLVKGRHGNRWLRKLEGHEAILYYATEVTSRKRRTPVNVPEMIEKWKDCIVILCTAHDKDAIDKAEFNMDELLKPMLAAPVAQIREFYSGLMLALKADKAVPFFVWRIFDGWGAFVLEKASDVAPSRKLKKKLAGEVALLAMNKQTKTDLVEALAGALMWRDPEALVEMREELQTEGVKPRIKGRESCLFLVTEKRGVERRKVML